MQIVIDIPDEEYERVMDGKWIGNDLADYIEEGIPLSKEHEDGKNEALDKIKSEIEALPKVLYPFVNPIYTYIKTIDVIKIIDKYKEIIENAKDEKKVLDKIKSEIGALPKTYPFINHFDTYVKEDDVKKIIDKYKEVIERNADSN